MRARGTTAERDALRAGFSLVEMAAVLALLGGMMALAAPAWRSLAGVSGRRGGVSLVLGTFERARAMAIVGGSPVYVAFAGPDAAPAYRGRSMAIYTENPEATDEETAGGDEAATPVPASRWERLPDGVSFKSEAISVLQSGQLADREFPVPSVVHPSGQMALHFIKFDEAGMVEYPVESGLLRLLIFEGSTDADGREHHTGGPGRDAGGGDRAEAARYFDEITVSRYTGKARLTPK